MASLDKLLKIYKIFARFNTVRLESRFSRPLKSGLSRAFLGRRALWRANVETNLLPISHGGVLCRADRLS